MNDELRDRINEMLYCAMKEKEIAGANVLVLHRGKKLVYAEAGWADVKTKKPIRRDTIFRIYSMTKPIVGAAVMLLLEQGKIDLAESISKYLNGFCNQKVQKGTETIPVCREVRIYDLLSMTSGIDYPNGERDPEQLFRSIGETPRKGTSYTTREVANALGRCPLRFQPGEQWEYSGAAADVLGAVIEQISGMTLGEFLKKHILEPMEMKDTAFYVPAEKQSRLATAYQKTESGLAEVEGARLGVCFDKPQPPNFEVGGCGLVSTIDDYAHFAQMLMRGGNYRGKQILRPDTVRYFTKAQLNAAQRESVDWIHMRGYSYGNLMRVMVKPEEAIMMTEQGEYGWDGWMGTYFSNDPKNELTLLLMTQQTEGANLTIARKLCNIVYSRLEMLGAGKTAGF